MTLSQKISRRELLAGTLGAGVASLLLQRRLWSAEAPVDPNRFVLLADAHVCKDSKTVHRNTNPHENFQRAREQYRAVNSRPAGLILAGDCAFLKGEAGDYQTLRDLVAPIPMPVNFALGNHDNRGRFWDAFPQHKATPAPVAGRHVTLLEAQCANWFLLDSLDETDSTPGRFGEKQLQWLAAELDRRQNKPALIVAHHQPSATDAATKNENGLLDTAQFYEVILPRKQVKAYMFGHTHRWEHSQIDDLHLVNIAALAWVFEPKQPQGWVDAQLNPAGVRLTLQCLDPAHQAHGRPLELAWRR